MGNSGKGLGIVALLIAIGALGFGLYQFILLNDSEATEIYTATNYNQIGLNIATIIFVIQPLFQYFLSILTIYHKVSIISNEKIKVN